MAGSPDVQRVPNACRFFNQVTGKCNFFDTISTNAQIDVAASKMPVVEIPVGERSFPIDTTRPFTAGAGRRFICTAQTNAAQIACPQGK